jgi:hypothetical protein
MKIVALNYTVNTIKISVLLLLMTLLLNIDSYAQTFMGIKVGPSFSSVSSSTQYKESVIPGVHIGFISNFWVNAAWQFQGELLYSQKGYNHVICAGSYDKLATSYLEMPLVFRYRAWPISTNFIMNFGGGLYGGYLLSGKYKTNLGDGEITETLDIASADQRFDAGIIFDVGVDRQLGKGKLFIDLRIQPGVLSTGVFPAESQSQRNITTMVSFSYLFGL